MISLGPLPEGTLGVAVSGGGDSVALLVLLHRSGRKLKAATVDHRLRAESASEAAGVSTLCAELGIPHTTLVWEHTGPIGNLQKAAREARQNLLATWAHAEGLSDIALGHTLDDQAETVLMRMARGSGVDGLAGMAVQRCETDLCWHRPLLGVRRKDLRAYLTEAGISWVDDPSNDDLHYNRIKARQALEHLASLGLTAERLAETAAHMRRARSALEDMTQSLGRTCVCISEAGELRLLAEPFAQAQREVQLRLLSASLCWVASAEYRPRFRTLEKLLVTCLSGENFGLTLHGCVIHRQKNEIVINRETSATPDMAPVSNRWDGRWKVRSEGLENLQIRALGEDGLQYCPGWRDSGHSRRALLASPSLWQEGRLIAAPLAQFGQIQGVKLAGGEKGFYDALITH